MKALVVGLLVSVTMFVSSATHAEPSAKWQMVKCYSLLPVVGGSQFVAGMYVVAVQMTPIFWLNAAYRGYEYSEKYLYDIRAANDEFNDKIFDLGCDPTKSAARPATPRETEYLEDHSGAGFYRWPSTVEDVFGHN